MFELTVAIVFGGLKMLTGFVMVSGALVWFTCEDACTKLCLFACCLFVCLFKMDHRNCSPSVEAVC